MKLCKVCGKYGCKEHIPIIGKPVNILDITEFSGSSPPSIFIGSKLPYPHVNVGIMSLPEIKNNAWIHNAPNYWSEKGLTKTEIINLRQSLINSRFRSNVFDIRKGKRLLTLIQEVGMASVQPDVEIKLENKPTSTIYFSQYNLPIGPSAQLQSAKLLMNPKILSYVEKVYSDTDLKSVSALYYLYKKGLDEHTLSQLLSIGVTGLKTNRKLVPTRNSITAIDDTIGKYLINKIKDYKIIDNYTIYFGGHYGNIYLILLFPEIFNYELFEIVLPKNTESNVRIMTDYENYHGRKDYAKETEGGYYAARLPILQYLEKIKRQASVLVIRFVLPEYDVPLGVWVCRNSVRKSLSSEPNYFETKGMMINYMKDIIRNKFHFNIENILKQSKLLNEIMTQVKLNRYL